MARTANTITGRSAFLSLLKDEGISHLFGNPGTTELPIMDALPDHLDLKYVLGLQEAIVVAMADGYSRASGELVACNVHVAPGLGNAMGALYNAKFTGTPMILTAGQQELGHGLREPLLYDPLVPIAEPLVKWAVEVPRLEDLPLIVRRAAKIATTPPTGPVFISLPGDILNAEGAIDLGQSSRVESATRPSDELVRRLAERIVAANAPVIVVGDEVVKSDGLKAAVALAEAAGAAVWQQTIAYGSHYPSEHACYVGTLSRDQKTTHTQLAPYDLMIAIGTDPLRMSVWSSTEAKPDALAIIQIGLVDWDIAKNYAVDIGVQADVAETMRALVPALRDVGGQGFAGAAARRVKDIATDNWSARRRRLASRIAESAAQETPISGDWLTLALAEALPDDCVFVNESLTSGRHVADLVPYKDRYSFHGLASGGIGWAVPAAVGIALAQSPRPVCCYVGDGSAMYGIQALWSAAHLKLPITFVIPNNGGYRILKQRLLAFHGNNRFIGMDLSEPELDFVGLAQSMGVPAHRVTNPSEVQSTLSAALRSGQPNLVEVMVDGSVA
ncbi:MAG: thiamine pyrophosphate-binding protein [Pseudomonadota bacterium]